MRLPSFAGGAAIGSGKPLISKEQSALPRILAMTNIIAHRGFSGLYPEMYGFPGKRALFSPAGSGLAAGA